MPLGANIPLSLGLLCRSLRRSLPEGTVTLEASFPLKLPQSGVQIGKASTAFQRNQKAASGSGLTLEIVLIGSDRKRRCPGRCCTRHRSRRCRLSYRPVTLALTAFIAAGTPAANCSPVKLSNDPIITPRAITLCIET